MYCPGCGKTIPENSAFCPGCGKPTVATPVIPAPTKKPGYLDSTLRIVGAVALIILGLILVGVYLNSRHAPITEKVFTGQMVVKAGQKRFWKLTLTPRMSNIQLVGSFHAQGGTGNDIQAIIASEAEYENWKNGHRANVYYSTDRTTNGQFNVHLAPGTYVVAFNNDFSMFADKEVTADIELHYMK
jgi:hypothetical protein